MIAAQELRLGSVVKNNIGIEFIVTEIKKVGIRGSYFGRESLFTYDDITPIPLTPEILEKCGFELEYKSEWTIFYTLTDNPKFGYDWGKSFGWRIRYLGNHFNNIKSIHQLQNLYFALTGQELTINL